MSGERESPVEREEAKNNGVVCGYVLCVYVCVSVCLCVCWEDCFWSQIELFVIHPSLFL